MAILYRFLVRNINNIGVTTLTNVAVLNGMPSMIQEWKATKSLDLTGKMTYQWKGWMEETHRIFIYLSDDEDSLIWIGNKVDGYFSVNLAYNIYSKGKEENRI